MSSVHCERPPGHAECITSFDGFDFPVIDIEIGYHRFLQLSPTVKPPSTDFFLLLSNIFAHIRNRRMIIPRQLQRRRKAQRPVWNIVHSLPALGEPLRRLRCAPGLARLASRAGDRAGIHQRQSVIEEAVQVNGSVLMPFRHKEITQPLAPHAIVRPPVQNPSQRLHVVPVDLRRVQRQRHEPTEIITKRKVSEACSRPPHASFLIGGGRSFPRLFSRLGGAPASRRLFPMLFPSGRAEA